MILCLSFTLIQMRWIPLSCAGLGFGVWGLGFGVWGLGLGFGVWDLGFEVLQSKDICVCVVLFNTTRAV